MKSKIVNVCLQWCLVLVAVLVMAGTVHAEFAWQAFNDTSPSGSGTKTDTTKVTIYTLTNNARQVDGVSHGSSGALKDFATQAAVTPTVTFSELKADANGTQWPNEFLPGTPAHDLFVVAAENRIDMNQAGTSVRAADQSGNPDWFVDMAFADLDPNKTYTLATTLNRAKDYPTRWTKISISGADDFVNESLAGIASSGSSIPGAFFNPGSSSDYVSIIAGNHVEGAIAQWTGIDPGADGSFSIRFISPTDTAETGGLPIATNDGYGPTAFMLAEEVPEPSTIVLAAIGLLGLLFVRRIRK